MKAATHPRTTRHNGHRTRSPGADVDPDLERQLVSATNDEPVEAVLVLRRDDAGAPCAAISESLLKRACGNQPGGVLDSHYLPRLGVLIVRACPRIIRRLIAQPEIAIACANRVEDGQPTPAAKGVRQKEADR